MPKQHLDPSELFPSRQYGFSQVVTARGGTTVYVSGQVGWDERQALRNVETALHAAGGRLSDVVSMRIYVVPGRMEESRAIREALLEFFPDEPPTTTWIGVHSLADKDFLVEIEPIAVIE